MCSEQKARDCLGIEPGGRGHPFMSLTRQLLDADIREHGSKGVRHIEMAWTLGPDLEHHRDAKSAKAFGVEIVSGQRPKITQGCRGISDDRRPELGCSQLVQLLHRNGIQLVEKYD